ncbi:MAG: GTPase Era [Alphaproteobacteria bacterium]|nr:GTPase Era [Alphaproteobacteria bacterium]
MNSQKTRCGFVSVLGLPNAGKSTLVNALVGQKVSIVSRKVQTTRTRILGLALHENNQIVMIDTPGVFSPKKTLEKSMVSAALSSIEGTDIIIHLVDAAKANAVEEAKAIQAQIKDHEMVILVLNKIDKISKDKLLKLSQDLNEGADYKACFMISALKNSGVGDLKAFLAEKLPEQEWIFPEDQITDMPMRLWAAEITREKVYDLLHKELPYSIFVQTEDWEEFDNGDVKIMQILTVQKSSQKSIVLGKKGSKIKEIGQAARMELQALLDRKVHLKLHVRVQENWTERPEIYALFGLEL